MKEIKVHLLFAESRLQYNRLVGLKVVFVHPHAFIWHRATLDLGEFCYKEGIRGLSVWGEGGGG